MRTTVAVLVMTLVVLQVLPAGTGGHTPQTPGTDGRARADPTFTNVSAAAGFAGAGGTFFDWGDYDNDGNMDLLVDGRLWKNGGPSDYNFMDVTATAGLSGGGAGPWVDWNNDGYIEFYGGGVLWKNNGPPTYNFSDVTATVGSPSVSYYTGNGWGDYDRDGDVDLYLMGGEDWNGGNPVYYADKLYRNNGDSTFTDVSAQTGVAGAISYYGRSASWGDYDNDFWSDLYIGNYRQAPNYLWHNNKDGTLTDVASMLGVADSPPDTLNNPDPCSRAGHSVGSDWGDYDGDGDLDLIVGTLNHKDWRTSDDTPLYRNNGYASGFNFTNVRGAAGISVKPNNIGGGCSSGAGGGAQGDELIVGSTWGDIDNDGDLDLWMPQIYDINYAYSYLYRNDGPGNPGRFTDIANALNMRVIDTYGGAWGDYDNDGDMDLVTGGRDAAGGPSLIHLFRNNGNANHWLEVRLNGTESNRAAIGARVKVTAGGVSLIREVEAGTSSHGQQNSMVLHFGLGAATTADVEVTWPSPAAGLHANQSGRVQVLSSVAVDRILTITEPQDKPPVFQSVSVAPLRPLEDDAVTLDATVAPAGGATIVKYQWDANGDGVFEYNSSVSASYTFTAPTRPTPYMARIRAVDNLGIAADALLRFDIVNVPPVAKVVAQSINTTMDAEVEFNGTPTRDTPSDMANMTYKWVFGDGTSINWQKSPVARRAYTKPGNFTAMFTAKDNDNATATANVTVRVVNVLPDITAPANLTVEEDGEVSFSPQVNDTRSDRLTYSWDFGDGSSVKPTTLSAAHTYTRSGTYNATLTVKDLYGAVVPKAVRVTVLNLPPDATITRYASNLSMDFRMDFSGEALDTPTDVADGLQYMWDFGDGAQTAWSDSPSASHAFNRSGNFTVTFTAKDNDEAVGMATGNVSVTNAAPVPAIQFDGEAAEMDSVVEFGGTGDDTPSDRPALQFRWNFGDGTGTGWVARDELTTAHTYRAPGIYNLTLTAMDDEGATGTAVLALTVNNILPTATAKVTKQSADEDERLNFTADGKDSATDQPNLTYEWNFGDGSRAVGRKAEHAFNRSGSFKVTLRVSDPWGGNATDSRLTIKVSNLPPVARLNISRAVVNVGESVTFDGTGSGDTPGDLSGLTYLWELGDSSVLRGAVVNHTYRSPGNYPVTLTVTDGDGAKATATGTVTVQKKKVAGPVVGGTSSTVVVAGAGLVVAVAAAGAVIILYRKRRGGSEPEPLEQSAPSPRDSPLPQAPAPSAPEPASPPSPATPPPDDLQHLPPGAVPEPGASPGETVPQEETPPEEEATPPPAEPEPPAEPRDGEPSASRTKTKNAASVGEIRERLAKLRKEKGLAPKESSGTRRRACPNCGEELERGWSVCPTCDTVIGRDGK